MRISDWSSDVCSSDLAFLCDAHGRDHLTVAELALDADGRFLAQRVQTIANMGAYLSTFAPCVPTYLYATLLAGQSPTPALHCHVKRSEERRLGQECIRTCTPRWSQHTIKKTKNI